jgi:hypothetical protein
MVGEDTRAVSDSCSALRDTVLNLHAVLLVLVSEHR